VQERRHPWQQAQRRRRRRRRLLLLLQLPHWQAALLEEAAAPPNQRLPWPQCPLCAHSREHSGRRPAGQRALLASCGRALHRCPQRGSQCGASGHLRREEGLLALELGLELALPQGWELLQALSSLEWLEEACSLREQRTQ
jgi:hypothetical protein